MKFKKKLFLKFLLSNKSNFISYAISKIHNTYYKHSKNENIYPIFSFINKIPLIFDDINFDYKKKSTTDVLIISNLVSANKPNNDIYFGTLGTLLKREKVKIISVYRNHTLTRSKVIRKYFRKNNILLAKRLNYLNEIVIIFTFIKELLIFIFSNKYLIIKKHLHLRDFLSIISNLRLIYQLDELLKLYKPKFVIFTYEGHAWERLLISLCKNYKGRTKSIAFQFSLLKKNQIGFFNKLKKDYNPDYIATSGKIPEKIIKRKIKFSKIIKVGSSKYTKSFKKNNKNKKFDLLISLDTDWTILLKTLNFCINFAQKNINYNFLLRLHPIVSDDKKLLNYIKSKIAKISNIKISKNSLESDLKTSRHLLYTESAICITALKYNVIPLFFKINNVNNIFDNKFPKKNVIKKFSDLDFFIKDKRNKKLSKYFKNYRDNFFEKYYLKKLIKLIKDK